LVPAFAFAAGGDEPLYKFDGKTYTAKSLGVSEQQQLFDIRSEAETRINALIDQAALNQYLDEAAKKDGKTRAEEEAKLMPVSDPTDQQVKDWYEQNKARIPPGYTLEKISGEIKKGLSEQTRKEKRDELLAKLKSDGKLVYLQPQLEAPIVKLDVANFPSKGAPAAKVTIVEFADYQCPHCKAAMPIVEGVLKKHEGKVRFVFVDYPIKGEFSELAAQGAYCAEQEGKYWEYHDHAYEKQETLHSKDAAAAIAKDVGLNADKFSSCLNSVPAKGRVEQGKKLGDSVGLTGTPSIYVNGRKIRGYDEADIEKEVVRALKGEAS
jgi:protein-disulfide isomerase